MIFVSVWKPNTWQSVIRRRFVGKTYDSLREMGRRVDGQAEEWVVGALPGLGRRHSWPRWMGGGGLARSVTAAPTRGTCPSEARGPAVWGIGWVGLMDRAGRICWLMWASGGGRPSSDAGRKGSCVAGT